MLKVNFLLIFKVDFLLSLRLNEFNFYVFYQDMKLVTRSRMSN